MWFVFGVQSRQNVTFVSSFLLASVLALSLFVLEEPHAVTDNNIIALKVPATIFFHVKFPTALPQFFSGLKISASYAVVGAVISEWLGGFEGLGVYMTRVSKAYAFDKMFAVIIFIVIISLL